MPGLRCGGGLPWLGIAAVVVLTGIVLTGMRRSNVTNIIIVTVTLAALGAFVVAGLPTLLDSGGAHMTPFFAAPNDGAVGDARGFLYATALMFVAYTGYGRIATLGEEVKDPSRTIPRAIVMTLIVSATLYMAVGIVAVGTVGAEALSAAAERDAAPLEVVARRFAIPGLPGVVAVGAITAMLGVLLNLILGLSRVLLAMGRRGDMPAATARLDAAGRTPYVAVVVIGVLIAGLAATGSVKTTWSFSAFTVLIYYAITNLAALRLTRAERLFSAAFSWAGLIGCLFLAFWVEWRIWLTGVALIAGGLVWHVLRRRAAGPGDGGSGV